jgi:ATP-dependent Clp protease protease subunit
VDGLAASIASVIALAGDKTFTAPNAMWMVHNPWTYAVGNADDLAKTADDLRKTQQVLLDLYVRKTGKTSDQIKALMDAETWMERPECPRERLHR